MFNHQWTQTLFLIGKFKRSFLNYFIPSQHYVLDIFILVTIHHGVSNKTTSKRDLKERLWGELLWYQGKHSEGNQGGHQGEALVADIKEDIKGDFKGELKGRLIGLQKALKSIRFFLIMALFMWSIGAGNHWNWIELRLRYKV